MGKVILNKNGKRITIREWMFKLFNSRKGLYCYDDDTIRFDDSITDIIFQNFRFNDGIYIDSKNYQNFLFQNCEINADRLIIRTANDIYLDSFFHNSRIEIDSDSCSINLLPDSEIGDLHIKSLEANIFNESKKEQVNYIRDYDIVSDSVLIQDVHMKSDLYSYIKTKQLKIENSTLENQGSLSFETQYFDMDSDTILASNSFVSFYNLYGQMLANYASKNKNQVVVLKDDLVDEKNRAIYSLLSVLSGISNKMASINKKINQDFNRKLELVVKDRKDQLEQQINILQQEYDAFENNIMEQRGKYADGINKRLIKEIQK